MGISNYGLWKGTPTSWNGKADTDHGHLIFTDSTDSSKSHEADVNIMSSGKETRLVYWLVSSYKAQKPSTSQLQALSQGFSKQSGSTSLALDLLREGIVDVDTGVLLSHDANKDADEKGDILSYLDPIMDEAVSAKATIYIWGSQYKDSDGSSGIHDIHMNQGSAGSFEKENGTYQDGGVVIEFGGGRWEGVFLAFASQATKTDSSGNPDGPTFAATLGGSSSSGTASPSTGGTGTSTGTGTGTTTTSSPTKGATTKGVSIEAALVNPTGPDDAPTSGGQGETVYVLNRSSKAQSLEGWTVGNDKGGSQALSGSISANVKKEVAVEGFRLSNKGGKIVLKDGKGETVSEVSYTEKQARKEGKLLYFAN